MTAFEVVVTDTVFEVAGVAASIEMDAGTLIVVGGSSGGGGVTGPSSSINGRPAVWVGTGGDVLGVGAALGTAAAAAASDFATAAQGAKADTAMQPGTGVGGVLSGTALNPGFAVNMAEQAELDAVASARPTFDQVDDRIADVVGTAPANLDTLGEIADALADDDDVHAALVTSIAGKQAASARLTEIAALDQNGTILRQVGGVWIASTYADIKAALAVTKGDVGLGNADNTSDANKPVSTATQTALDTKQAAATALSAIGALNPAADRFPYFTGASTAALATITSFIRGVLDDPDAATARATLGVTTTGMFGTGADGNVTISANTTITSDFVNGFKCYDNLTIDAGVTLTVVGILFVKNTLTINGTLSAAGNHAVSNAQGLRVGGPFTATVTNNAGPNGANASAGTAGSPIANPVSGQIVWGGGRGGSGGAGSAGAGGVAGILATTTTPSVAAWLANLTEMLTGTVSPLAAAAQHVTGGGTGGGGGAGSTTTGIGGGGGSGGGMLIVCARHVAGSGTMTAAGGNGGNAFSGASSGGGGGGGGGVLALATADTAHTFTINVAGGSGGAPTGTGTAGSAGSAGSFQFFPGGA